MVNNCLNLKKKQSVIVFTPSKQRLPTQEEFKSLCLSALGQWNGELWLFIYVMFKWFYAISFLHNFIFVMEKSNINSIPLLIFHGKHDDTNFRSV